MADSLTNVLLSNGMQQFCDANGAPLVGGKVWTYLPGTNTLAMTWQDPLGAAPNLNPLLLDGAGRATIWGTGLYRQVVRDQFGNLVWDKVTGQVPLLTQLQQSSEIDACFTYDRDVVFRYDNSGVAISAGVLGDLYTTFDGTITGWVLQGDQSGAIELDVWALPYADNAPPTNAASITGTAQPTIANGNESASGGDQSPTGANPLTGWDTTVNSGQWWRIDCVSCTNITRFTLTLRVMTLAQITFQTEPG